MSRRNVETCTTCGENTPHVVGIGTDHAFNRPRSVDRLAADVADMVNAIIPDPAVLHAPSSSFLESLRDLIDHDYSFASSHRFIVDTMDTMQSNDEDAKQFWLSLNEATSRYEKKYHDNVPADFVYDFAKSYKP